MAEKTREFENLLLNAIDEALLLLGESGRQSVYTHLEKNFIQKTEIAQKIIQFQIELEKIFGVGARFIEILIMKNLHAKIDGQLNADSSFSLNLLKYVEDAKQRYLKEHSSLPIDDPKNPSDIA